MKKETVIYLSSNGRSRISAKLFLPEDDVPVKGMVQISHGMCEYVGRYEQLAQYLCDRGYAVCGNDHLGHKNTALLNRERLGYFGNVGSWSYLVEDLELLRQKLASRFPRLPWYLLGHSMGSFIARMYLHAFGMNITGLILSGTAGTTPAALAGKSMAASSIVLHGPRYVSNAVYGAASKSFNRRIHHPKTWADWISRDPDVCAAYVQDPYCNFKFCVSAYYDLFQMLLLCNRKEWYGAVRRTLPVLLISGEEDPVGNYGKGPREVAEKLLKRGLDDVTLLLYPGGRHEMFNEINRTEVYEDLYQWLERETTETI